MKQAKRAKNLWADHFTRKAQKDRYPARSVYKLQEIQKKHRLIKKDYKILDLGCAPGSWLKYAVQLTGPGGRIIGIDLKPVEIQLPNNVCTIIADIFSLDDATLEMIGTDFNAVISDMAPNTTGNKDVDTARSSQLCRQALKLAEKLLLPGGVFICKIFQGSEFKEFVDTIKSKFNTSYTFKPQSSRKKSKEIFIIGQGKK